MNVKKKTIIQELEVEYRDDNTPVERMRHKDSDGDGISDFVDNGYSKPNDKYQYREINKTEYDRLKKAGYDTDRCCRKSNNKPDNYILRFTAEQSKDIDVVLRPIVKRTVAH